jgi:hypothetical protein
MAAFIDYINTPSAQDYSSRSKGIDRARPNTAFGELFEGLGKVVDSGIKTADQANIDQINRELEVSVDAVRGAQGVDAAVNDPTVTGGNGINGASGASPTPPAIGVGTSEVARLTEAYKEGKISDTYYFAKIESEARRMRAKFPGYRDEIDQKVSSIIGTNPANALRSSIISDLKAAQSEARSRTNSDEAIIERGKNYISPEKYQRYISGDKSPAFVAELKTDIQQQEVKTQSITTMQSQYALRKAQGAARQEDIEGIATKDATDTVWNILNAGVDAAGGVTAAALNERIAAMSQGKVPTPEEIGQIRTGVAALIQQTELALDKKFSAGFSSAPNSSYASEIRNPERIKQIKELAMAPIRGMEKALTDNNIGMFSYYANQAKLMKDGAVQDLYARSNAARNLAAASDILGPNLGPLLLENGVLGKVVSDFAKVITTDGIVKGVTGTGNMQDILRDSLRETRSQPNAAGLAKESAGDLLTTYRRALANEKTDPRALSGLAKTIFNPERNFITDKDLLTSNSQMSVMAMYTGPDIVENLSKLKQIDPTAWTNYTRWVESSTRAVFNTTVGQLAEWQKSGSAAGAEVVVDNQGRISVTASRQSTPGSFPGAQSARESMVRGIEKQVSQLNSAIMARKAIAQKDGQDPNAVGLQFVQALGLRPTPTEGGSSQSTSRPSPLLNPSGDDRSENEEAFIQLASQPEPVDLEAQEARRSRTRPTGAVNFASVVPPTADLKTAVTVAAEELGTTPEDLLTVIGYETGGTYDPAIRGGKNDRHIGLIQFGDNEQAMYGARQDQSVGEQMQAVVKYLKHRGFQPGMGLLDLYSTINAGRPGLYNRSDTAAGGAPGTVLDKVNNQMAGHRRKALALLQE